MIETYQNRKLKRPERFQNSRRHIRFVVTSSSMHTKTTINIHVFVRKYNIHREITNLSFLLNFFNKI